MGDRVTERDVATTLCEAFRATASSYPDAVAIRDSEGDLELSWATYETRVRSIAEGLWALGVRPGQTVGMLLSNRPEFHLVDTAAFHLGATPFSIYSTLAIDQLDYVLDNADVQIVVTEAGLASRLRAAQQSGGRPVTIVSVDGGDADLSLADVESHSSDEFDFDTIAEAVSADTVATLIYTSGTTGPPKGVELTHRNLIEQVVRVAEVLPIEAGDTMTSYLPHAHIADRWVSHYNNIVLGVQVTTVADAQRVAAVLPALRPTLWGAVPRVVEKIKAALEAGIAAEPEPVRAALEAGIATGVEVAQSRQAGVPISSELQERHAHAEANVLAPLRAKLGLDRVKWMIVGAAPLARDVQEFLLGIGLPLTEVYGMSELSCVLSVAPVGEARIGTVGPPIRGVETRVADDGELLVRGVTVMRGYRNDPDRTAEAIDSDGWMHTGDVVKIEDGHIRIVDRIKELIITSGGKNLSPANIEGELKSASGLIGQAIAIGDGRPYVSALLVLDPDGVAVAAADLGISDATLAEIAADQRIRDSLAVAVADANERLARVEQIKRFDVIVDEWLPGGDELTPTLKLRRRAIHEKYAERIERLYASDGPG